MSVTKEQIIEAIGEMSVLDVVDLIEQMEDKFNVTAAAPVAVAAAGGGEAAAAEEKTEFDVMLKSFDNKVGAIKAVRAITGLGLKEAKELVEKAPVAVKEGATKEEAEDIKAKLTEAGAEVEVK